MITFRFSFSFGAFHNFCRYPIELCWVELTEVCYAKFTFLFACLSLLQNPMNGDMNENQNGPSRSGSPGDEDIPLIYITPSLSRRKRALDLSQLSLRSVGSHDFVAPVAENGDVTVGMATVFKSIIRIKQ